MSAHCSECGAPVPVPSPSADSVLDGPVSLEMLARHQELMNTNAPPQGAELTFIRAVVSKADGQVARLDDQISRVRDQLRKLENQRASLSTYQGHNKSIVSPLRRMPPEVLSEIFSWTIPLPNYNAMDRPDLDTRSPWTLTHVSRHWRAVAISTPSLWSLVAVSFYRKKTLTTPMLKAQLERARTLRVYFFGCQKKPLAPQLELFQLLAEHSRRWEQLFIDLTPDLVPVLATVRNRLGLLRKLETQWAHAEIQSGVVMDYFQTAPSLLNATIHTKLRPVSILLPSHQLTRYDLMGPWDMHREILKAGSNLLEAHISINFDKKPWPSPVEIIHMAVLRRLYISHAEALAYIRAPAAQTICHPPAEPDVLLRHLEAFVQRSGCSLRGICLQGSPSAHTTAAILAKFPSISELAILTEVRRSPEFKHWDAPDAPVNILISQMTIPNPTGNAIIAPHLSKIYFGCRGKTSIDYGLYLRMLQSRWKAADCAVQSAALLIDSGPVPDSTTRSGLIALRRAGLDLFLLEGYEASEELRSWVCSSTWT